MLSSPTDCNVQKHHAVLGPWRRRIRASERIGGEDDARIFAPSQYSICDQFDAASRIIVLRHSSCIRRHVSSVSQGAFYDIEYSPCSHQESALPPKRAKSKPSNSTFHIIVAICFLPLSPRVPAELKLILQSCNIYGTADDDSVGTLNGT